MICRRIPRICIPSLPRIRERRIFTHSITRRVHTQQPVGPFTVTVQGPHVNSEDTADHREPLLSQLENIPQNTTILTIGEDPPSDTEWGILGEHFTDIQDLTLDSGFHEDLNDKKMPLHWPLERLKISGVCGEVTQTPHIRQGKISHLILYFTSELRFEGPTSAELHRAHKEAIDRGEAQPRYLGEGSKIQLFNISELARNWMKKKYPTKVNLELEESPAKGKEIRLRTLEIIENDALDTFQRMTVSLPHSNTQPPLNALCAGLLLDQRGIPGTDFPRADKADDIKALYWGSLS